VIPNSRSLFFELIDAWNTHDLDRACAFFAADYEGDDIAQRETQLGPSGMREALSVYYRALPDVRFAIDDLVLEGERAVILWTARGTHRGSLMNIPPSNRAVAVRGVSALTVRGGKVVRALYIWDLAGLLRSIGLLPEL
jgi:steroid delta-isomerase-like uncharacterized protein